MINFTHNNHLKYYIGGRLFGFRNNPFEKYEAKVGRIDMAHFKKSSWLQEQYRIADLIYRDLGKDFVVMFSGGTDSEIVLRSFKHIGVTPRPVFIKFKGDYNLGELIAALEVTDDLGIELEVIEFDIIDFYLSGEATEFNKAIQSTSTAFSIISNQVLKLQTAAIMGGSFTLVRNPTVFGSIWVADFTESEGASVRLSNKYGIPLLQEWFSYTPEVIGYFLEHPALHEVITNNNLYKNYTDGAKNAIFKNWMPSIISKKKKTGYETIRGFRYEIDLQNHRISPRLESCIDGIPLEALMLQLYGENYGSN